MTKGFHAPSKLSRAKDAKLIKEIDRRIKEGSLSDDDFENGEKKQLEIDIQEL